MHLRNNWMSMMGLPTQQKKRQTTTKIVAGTMAGVAAGVAAGMLMSPKPGKQLRDDLTNVVRGSVENIKQGAQQVVNNAQTQVQQAQAKGQQAKQQQ